jgi:hypothetical protein
MSEISTARSSRVSGAKQRIRAHRARRAVRGRRPRARASERLGPAEVSPDEAVHARPRPRVLPRGVRRAELDRRGNVTGSCRRWFDEVALDRRVRRPRCRARCRWRRVTRLGRSSDAPASASWTSTAREAASNGGARWVRRGARRCRWSSLAAVRVGPSRSTIQTRAALVSDVVEDRAIGSRLRRTHVCTRRALPGADAACGQRTAPGRPSMPHREDRDVSHLVHESCAQRPSARHLAPPDLAVFARFCGIGGEGLLGGVGLARRHAGEDASPRRPSMHRAGSSRCWRCVERAPGLAMKRAPDGAGEVPRRGESARPAVVARSQRITIASSSARDLPDERRSAAGS